MATSLFDACLALLPESTARVFMMREFIGFDTAEICAELGISENNCWVILHRARMRLRLCLVGEEGTSSRYPAWGEDHSRSRASNADTTKPGLVARAI